MLTAKQEAFAQAIAAGKSQSDAYREAYPIALTWAPASVWEAASRLVKNSKVIARVEALKQELAARQLWTREEAVKLLRELLEKNDKTGDVISIIKTLNAMHGIDEPDPTEPLGPDGKPLTHVTLILDGHEISPEELGW